MGQQGSTAGGAVAEPELAGPGPTAEPAAPPPAVVQGGAGAEVWLANAAHLPTADWLATCTSPQGPEQLAEAIDDIHQAAAKQAAQIEFLQPQVRVAVPQGGPFQTHVPATPAPVLDPVPDPRLGDPFRTQAPAIPAPGLNPVLDPLLAEDLASAAPALERLSEEAKGNKEPMDRISFRGITAVGSSADFGRGRPTAGRTRHAARTAPGNKVFCVASGDRSITLYHAGEQEQVAQVPANAGGACGFCGAVPVEPPELPDTSNSVLGCRGTGPKCCTHWVDPRASEITCVHATEEESGAAALYCCARSGAISKRGLSGQMCGVLQGTPGWVSCALALQNSLFVGSEEGVVREWDLRSAMLIRTLELYAAGCVVCMLAPQGGAAGTLFCGCNDGTMMVWSLDAQRPEDKQLLRGIRGSDGHDRSVRCLHESAGDSSVFSGSMDSRVGKWDAFTGHRLWDLKALTGWASCLLAWEPGQTLFTGCEDGSIVRRGLRNGERHSVQYQHDALKKAHANAVTALVAMEEPSWLFSGAEDGSIRKWHMESGQLLQSLEGHGGAVMCMLACQAEDTLMTGASDALLRQWNMRTGALLHTAKVFEGTVTGYVVRDPATQVNTPRVAEVLANTIRSVGPPALDSVPELQMETASPYRCPVGHELVLINAGPPQTLGTVPGTCDNCEAPVPQNEAVYECQTCNWWLCKECAARASAAQQAALQDTQPTPFSPVNRSSLCPDTPEADALTSHDFPFPGWKVHRFPVDTIRDKVAQDVRLRIQTNAGQVQELPMATSTQQVQATGDTLQQQDPEVLRATEREARARAAEERARQEAEEERARQEAAEERAWQQEAEERARRAAEQAAREAQAAQGEQDELFGRSDLNQGELNVPAQPSSSSAEPMLQDGETYFKVSNHELQSHAHGLGYRMSPQMDDKFPDKSAARWGDVVTGVDMGNNFVRTTTGFIAYLPKVVQGPQGRCEVLVETQPPQRRGMPVPPPSFMA